MSNFLFRLLRYFYICTIKPYIQKYFDFFGFTEADFIPCEIPECGQQAVDIAHIDARGRGGDPTGSKDRIENLMASCRAHHLEYGDKKQFKEWLKEVHLEYMQKFGK